MKKFKLHKLLDNKSCYLITRNSRIYEFFDCEYHNLARINGNIIVPRNEIDERTVEQTKPKTR